MGARERRDVKRLTQLLREDKAMADLRLALEKKGIVAKTAILAGFFEDEVGGACGALAVSDGTAIRFERAKGRFRVWEKVADVKGLTKSHFPALLEGIAMAKKGEL